MNKDLAVSFIWKDRSAIISGYIRLIRWKDDHSAEVLVSVSVQYEIIC